MCPYKQVVNLHLSALIPKTSKKSTETGERDLTTAANDRPAISENATNAGRQTRNFVRLRFQIDYRAATEVNVDELVNFLKGNIKVEGSKNNLTGVEINQQHHSDINIMSKVLLKKKYLKQLAKKYLKKKKQSHYHAILKNKRAYKILLKVPA